MATVVQVPRDTRFADIGRSVGNAATDIITARKEEEEKKRREEELEGVLSASTPEEYDKAVANIEDLDLDDIVKFTRIKDSRFPKEAKKTFKSVEATNKAGDTREFSLSPDQEDILSQGGKEGTIEALFPERGKGFSREVKKKEDKVQAFTLTGEDAGEFTLKEIKANPNLVSGNTLTEERARDTASRAKNAETRAAAEAASKSGPDRDSVATAKASLALAGVDEPTDEQVNQEIRVDKAIKSEENFIASNFTNEFTSNALPIFKDANDGRRNGIARSVLTQMLRGKPGQKGALNIQAASAMAVRVARDFMKDKSSSSAVKGKPIPLISKVSDDGKLLKGQVYKATDGTYAMWNGRIMIILDI